MNLMVSLEKVNPNKRRPQWMGCQYILHVTEYKP